MSLPDRRRASLAPPARALAVSAVHFTRRLTWRTLHPADRERFVEAPAPPPLVRLPYQASDGWSAPLFHVPAAPGGAGEPVVLAHGLGLGPDAFRYGDEPTLAGALAAAGFDVFLFTHRGDRDATPPIHDAPCDFDAMLERDVPAALEVVRQRTGFDRVHWVGHGLGGQLGLIAAGRREALASVVAMGAPVMMRAPTTELRRAGMIARLLPAGWTLPADTLARLALPALGNEPWFGDAPGSRVRGVLEHATETFSAGLVDQLAAWIDQGSISSRGGVVDWTTTLPSAEAPLLVVYGRESRTADQASTTAALHRWGHPDALGLGVPGRSLDLLLGRRRGEVFGPVVDWLSDRRRLAWSAGHRACG
jgi:pimeloyl-ACP methyl ester carboxylesterase